MLVIVLIIVSFLLVISLFIAWDKIVVGKVPYISIPAPTLTEIISHINIKNDAVFYDLGCGDGRVLLAAAQKQPSAKYIGIEKAFGPYCIAKLKTLKHANIHIHRGDILKAQIPSSAIVFCYLLPELLVKLPKYKQLISVEYAVPDRKPTKSVLLKKHSRLIKRMFFYYS
jgi:SAM-dependent methyltransferase